MTFYYYFIIEMQTTFILEVDEFGGIRSITGFDEIDFIV